MKANEVKFLLQGIYTFQCLTSRLSCPRYPGIMVMVRVFFNHVAVCILIS